MTLEVKINVCANLVILAEICDELSCRQAELPKISSIADYALQ